MATRHIVGSILVGLFAACGGGGVDDSARVVGDWSATDTTGQELEHLTLRADGTYAHRLAAGDDHHWDGGTFVADGSELHFDGRDVSDGSAVRVDLGYHLDGDELTIDPVASSPSSAQANARATSGPRVLYRVAP